MSAQDKAKVIFGNEIKECDYKKAGRNAERLAEKHGDDREMTYHLRAKDNDTLFQTCALPMIGRAHV